jgi:hypothetical protein
MRRPVVVERPVIFSQGESNAVLSPTGKRAVHLRDFEAVHLCIDLFTHLVFG